MSMHVYMNVLPACGLYLYKYNTTASSVDRQVKSESFLGCNIVVDGYIICGIILL